MEMVVRSSGNMLAMDLPHSITMMFLGFWRFSYKSSIMRPGSVRR